MAWIVCMHGSIVVPQYVVCYCFRIHCCCHFSFLLLLSLSLLLLLLFVQYFLCEILDFNITASLSRCQCSQFCSPPVNDIIVCISVCVCVCMWFGELTSKLTCVCQSCKLIAIVCKLSLAVALIIFVQCVYIYIYNMHVCIHIYIYNTRILIIHTRLHLSMTVWHSP